MKDKEQILNRSIRDFSWPNFCEVILEDMFCYSIGNVLDLTVEKIRSYGYLTKNEMVGICNTLISINSELFYKSILFYSLKNDNKFVELIKRLNKCEYGVNL
ncbi:MAG: hypothetical protein IJW36_00010 [Clostridia bacterium]|nr:hypothetical protein [Clostridia bacterium]